MLGYYLDQAFGEGFIPSAKFRQSLIDLGHLVDVLIKVASPARTILRISRALLAHFADEVIVVPAYSVFTRQDGIPFTITQPVTIQVGMDYVDVEGIQGTPHTIHLQPSDFVITDRTTYPRFNLGKNVAADTVIVQETGTSYLWREVDSFWRSRSQNRDFLLYLYADNYRGETDTVFLTTGNGTYGKACPDTGLDVTYIVTDAERGNCGSGLSFLVPDKFLGMIAITNTTTASGGAAPESTEAFRARLPKVVRTQRRGVTKEDYNALLESIPGVFSIQAADRNDSWNWPHLYMGLYLMPEGGYEISDYLYAKAIAQCCEWGHLGNWPGRYVITPVNRQLLDVNCSFGVTQGFIRTQVEANVRQAIIDYFAPGRFVVGQSLNFSDLFLVISRIPGVAWIDFLSPTIEYPKTIIGSVLVLNNLIITVKN
jgi:hypothetical protein